MLKTNLSSDIADIILFMGEEKINMMQIGESRH